MAYRACAILKERHFMVAPTLEYATKLIHEGRSHLLKENQTFISTNQHSNLRDLNRQHIFDYAVSDFPILMHQIYYNHGREPLDFETFKKMTVQLHYDEAESFQNIEILCLRNSDASYEKAGRIHSHEEALQIDKQIMTLLIENNIDYKIYDPNAMNPEDFILEALDLNNPTTKPLHTYS